MHHPALHYAFTSLHPHLTFPSLFCALMFPLWIVTHLGSTSLNCGCIDASNGGAVYSVSWPSWGENFWMTLSKQILIRRWLLQSSEGYIRQLSSLGETRKKETKRESSYEEHRNWWMTEGPIKEVWMLKATKESELQIHWVPVISHGKPWPDGPALTLDTYELGQSRHEAGILALPGPAYL